MLVLYRRHLAACPHKSKGRTFKRCKCPIWIQGTLAGEAMRKSLDVTTWERAEEIKLEIQNGIKPEKPKGITVKDALAAFVKDCQGRNLGKSTLGKYKRLCERMVRHSELHGKADLSQWSVEVVRGFRDEWKVSARTASKEIERVRQFFKFCISNGWIVQNPATALKAPQVKTFPRIPFSDEDVNNILSHAEDDRELAFLMVLLHTGLRIGDASMLKISQFSGNRIYLYTSKAGTPVSIVVPESLVSLLKALPTTAGHFFLWGDSTHVHSVSNLWRRRIKAICKDLKIMPDHPHRFRHSLAADLLSRGVSVENVAAILGNSPAVVVKHYSQWIKGRQDALDAAIASTWESPKLVRVK
jgi:site-specific recombinase XerD